MALFKKISSYFSSKASDTEVSGEPVEAPQTKRTNRSTAATYVLVAIATIAAMAVVAYFAYVQFAVAGLTTAMLPHVFGAVGVIVSGAVLGLVVRHIDNNTSVLIDDAVEMHAKVMASIKRCDDLIRANAQSLGGIEEKVKRVDGMASGMASTAKGEQTKTASSAATNTEPTSTRQDRGAQVDAATDSNDHSTAEHSEKGTEVQQEVPNPSLTEPQAAGAKAAIGVSV